MKNFVLKILLKGGDTVMNTIFSNTMNYQPNTKNQCLH